MRTIIVDTSAIYALVDADNLHHDEAVAFLNQEGEGLTLIVTDTTLLESITLIKSRLGHSEAVRSSNAIHASPRFRLISLSKEDWKETWRIFEKYDDKAWSPFDCACLAAAQARNIDEAFAFDEHFDQMAGLGMIRLP